jgi:hypothetical protein
MEIKGKYGRDKKKKLIKYLKVVAPKEIILTHLSAKWSFKPMAGSQPAENFN